MLDVIIYFLMKYAYIIAVALFVIKVLLFVKNRNKNWTLIQFFYFDSTNMQFTQNATRIKLKRVQNQLSISIIVFIVIQVAIKVLLA